MFSRLEGLVMQKLKELKQPKNSQVRTTNQHDSDDNGKIIDGNNIDGNDDD